MIYTKLKKKIPKRRGAKATLGHDIVSPIGGVALWLIIKRLIEYGKNKNYVIAWQPNSLPHMFISRVASQTTFA